MSGPAPARACSTCIFICLVAGPSRGRRAETPRRSAPSADPPPRLTLIGPGWYPALRLRARRVSPPCHGHEIRSGKEARRLAEVRVGENETFESALRRFNKKIQQSGILAEARRREHYEKPSVKRKRKEAKKRKEPPRAKAPRRQPQLTPLRRGRTPQTDAAGSRTPPPAECAARARHA